MEDSEIIALYFARDERAIAETDSRYRSYCGKIASNILQNSEDAAEAVNETYMRVWESIPPEKPRILSAFIGRITRNICLSRLRFLNAEKRGSGRAELVYEELSEGICSENDVEKEFDAKELASRINSFLRLQKENDRRVFICRYWYFESVEEISERFGFSKSKVKSILFRMRKKLSEQLKEEGYI